MLLATSPRLAGVSGRYFEDCKEAKVVEQLDGVHGVMTYALDPEAARRLWDISDQLIHGARATAPGALSKTTDRR